MAAAAPRRISSLTCSVVNRMRSFGLTQAFSTRSTPGSPEDMHRLHMKKPIDLNDKTVHGKMKLIRRVFWSANAILNRQLQNPHGIRAFSASPFSGTNNTQNLNSSESVDEFQQRIFSDGNSPSLSAFYHKLDKAEKAHDRSGMNTGNRSSFLEGLDESYTTLTDGMDYKLKKAAAYFEFDPDEVAKEDYSFRPDVNFLSGMTYDTKDLDLGKTGVRKPTKRREFVTTTEEVLRNADFRNVKFLANFLTEAGIIIKRSQTGISAKAQRKIAREIKTARAFGLMPFTTMGTKHFKHGSTMEEEDQDFEFETTYDHNFVDDERGDDDMAA